MVFAMFGILWVMPRRVIYLFACWQGHLGRHPNSVILRAITHILCGVSGGSATGRLLRYVNRALLS
jgi:hypothetical protein